TVGVCQVDKAPLADPGTPVARRPHATAFQGTVDRAVYVDVSCATKGGRAHPRSPHSHGGKTHVSDDSGMTHPPRIVVVSREHWPRALLRAQLAEAGYDAIGADTLSRALRHPPDAERGPLRLVVVDVEPRAPRLRRSSTRFRQRLLASDARVR